MHSWDVLALTLERVLAQEQSRGNYSSFSFPSVFLAEPSLQTTLLPYKSCERPAHGRSESLYKEPFMGPSTCSPRLARLGAAGGLFACECNEGLWNHFQTLRNYLRNLRKHCQQHRQTGRNRSKPSEPLRRTLLQLKHRMAYIDPEISVKLLETTLAGTETPP